MSSSEEHELKDALIGHTTVRKVIERQLQSGPGDLKLLLAGEKGIGKLTLAERVLSGLHCEKQRFAQPCNACRPCKLLRVGAHPDHRALDGQNGSIGIDAIRDLLSWTYTTSQDARTILISQPESMTRAASNAFLKMLEEPPARTVILMTSERPDQLLPTIRSRVQQLRMYRVPLAEMKHAFPQRSNEELRQAAGRPGTLQKPTSNHDIAWSDLLSGSYNERRQALSSVFGGRRSFNEQSFLARDVLLQTMRHLRSIICVHLNLPHHAESQLPDSEQQKIANALSIRACRVMLSNAIETHKTLLLNIHPEMACEHLFLTSRS